MSTLPEPQEEQPPPVAATRCSRHRVGLPQSVWPQRRALSPATGQGEVLHPHLEWMRCSRAHQRVQVAVGAAQELQVDARPSSSTSKSSIFPPASPAPAQAAAVGENVLARR